MWVSQEPSQTHPYKSNQHNLDNDFSSYSHSWSLKSPERSWSLKALLVLRIKWAMSGSTLTTESKKAKLAQGYLDSFPGLSVGLPELLQDFHEVNKNLNCTPKESWLKPCGQKKKQSKIEGPNYISVTSRTWRVFHCLHLQSLQKPTWLNPWEFGIKRPSVIRTCPDPQCPPGTLPTPSSVLLRTASLCLCYSNISSSISSLNSAYNCLTDHFHLKTFWIQITSWFCAHLL